MRKTQRSSRPSTWPGGTRSWLAGLSGTVASKSRLRQFIAGKGAPSEYQLTKGLEKLQLTGGGGLQWRSHPVAMVWFNRGDDQMLFLFVMKRSALKDPPAETPQVSKVTELQMVSWTQGGYTCVLAGPEEPQFLRKYL